MNIFNEKNCFKLICGAGNENTCETEKLVYVYSKAGCCFFDISANEKVFESAKNGILKAQNTGYICISTGTNDDVHLSKAKISAENCIKCGQCAEICPQNAIKDFSVIKENCVGCGRCLTVCPKNCIEKVFDKKNISERLPKSLLTLADCIELHISSDNEDEILSCWKYLNKNFRGILSICLSLQKLQNDNHKKLISQMVSDRKPYTTIIQADGNPMSGGSDDFETTRPAIEAAKIVNGLNLPVYLLVSGGTNTKTAELAKTMNVKIDGVAMGSFARKAVKEYINTEDFWTNEQIQQNAIQKAKEIILSTRFAEL